jgi:Flp pilus assembly protein TadB
VSQLDNLREQANREPDPEKRRQRLAKLAEIEAGMQEVDRRLANARARLVEVESARKWFFTRTALLIGLAVLVVLAGSFSLGLPSTATLVIVCLAALAVALVQLFRLKRRLRNLR